MAKGAYQLLICFVLMSLGSVGLQGQELPQYFVFDGKKSETFGSENIATVHRLMYSQLDKSIPGRLWDETKLVPKLGGMGYRGLKLFLFDFQEDFLFALAQHEAFGHGARYREHGAHRVPITMDLFFPFGEGAGSASPIGVTEFGFSFSMANAFGGNEANSILANNLEARMLLEGGSHYRQSLLYLTSRNNLLFYSFRTWRGLIGGDVFSYINDMNFHASFTGSGKQSDINRLFTYNLISLLNPMQLQSALTLAKDHVLDGNTRRNSLPTLKIGKSQYMPALDYNLTPFGPEFLMNHYLLKNEKLYQLNLRLGEQWAYSSFYGLGIKSYNLISNHALRLHGSLDLWNQPKLTYVFEGAPEDLDLQAGAMAKISCSWFPFKPENSLVLHARSRLGLHAELVYKSTGYAQGEPLRDGGIIRFGIALNMAE